MSEAQKRRRRIILICCLALLTVVVAVVFIRLTTQPPEDAASEPLDLIVHFIDVGQGDAIFIDYGDYDVLIDAGDNDAGELVAGYIKALQTDDIEIMVATHPHADHIGGLDDVLSAFVVEKVIDSGMEYDSQAYTDYMTAVANERNMEFVEDNNMLIDIGNGIVLEVIETGDNHDDTNANSVLCKLDYNDIEFLFTGDMEADIERTILDRNLQADILKVGHHGSRTSTSLEFLQAVNPAAAIISAGEGNRYNHPHDETIQKLQSNNIDIYGTWAQGTIVVTTNGETFTVNVEPLQLSVEKKPKPEATGVAITGIDKSAEVVTITNNTNSDVDLSGWYLVSVLGDQRFDFPESTVLKAGETLYVTAGKNAQEDATHLKWTGSYVWSNDESDPGELYDETGELVSSWPR